MSRTSFRIRACLWLVLSAAAGTAVFSSGCRVSSSALCESICDCQGCSESDLDECVDDLDDERKGADDAGCGDAYDDWLGCVNDQLRCVDDEIDADGCDAESKALSKCAKGGIGFGDVCAQAAEHVSDCIPGSMGTGGENTECSGVIECQSSCINDAPCAALTGENGDLTQDLVDCFSSCTGSPQ